MKIRRIDNRDVLHHAKSFTTRKPSTNKQSLITNCTYYKQDNNPITYNINTNNTNINTKRQYRQSIQTTARNSKLQLLPQKIALTNNRSHARIKSRLFKTLMITATNNNTNTNNSQYQQQPQLQQQLLSSSFTSVQHIKVASLCKRIALIYGKLQQLYAQNQAKLLAIVIKHVNQQYYIYSKQLLQIIRCARLQRQLVIDKILTLSHSNSNSNNLLSSSSSLLLSQQKLLYELSKFYQFLQTFYQQKCTKHIQITQASILQRELAIRNYTSKQRYKLITNVFCPKLITNEIDIVEQFRLMNVDNRKQLDRVQCGVFKRLRGTEGNVGRVFNSVCAEKENDLFQGRCVAGLIGR